MGLPDPLFRRENETVEPGLFSNPVELDGIKIRVVELLPDAEELDITRVDEHVGFFPDDRIDCQQEIIVLLFHAQVHAALRVAAFRERVSCMFGSVCADEFVAKPSFMGCQRCDYWDLCEVGGKGEK